MLKFQNNGKEIIKNKVMKSYTEALNDRIKYWFPIIMSLSNEEFVSLEKAFKKGDLEKIENFINNNDGITSCIKKRKE